MKDLSDNPTLEEIHNHIMNSEGVEIPDEIYKFIKDFQCTCYQEHNDSCMHSDLKGS